jgi:outer membrane lipopolysaccharide assembly protein LptE/RlpB
MDLSQIFSTNKNKHREAKHNPITKFLNSAPESATAKKSEEEQWRARQEMRERAARPKMKKRLLFTMPSLYTDG